MLRKVVISMFPTFERVRELAKKQGLSINQLEDKLSFGKNSLYGLKKSNPNSKIIEKIADYFNVSTDYLLGRTDNPRIASDKVADYTTEDLRKMAKNAKTFDGKPLTDEDVDAPTKSLKNTSGIQN